MLRSIRGFSTLPEIDLLNLCGQLRWHRVAAGKALMFHAGRDNESRCLHLICKGSVKTIVYALNGGKITYFQYDAGNFLGEITAIDQRPPPTHVVAVTDAVVASMDVGLFREVMQQHTVLSTEVAAKLCETVRGLSQRVFELSALTVTRRIDLEIYRCATHSSVDGTSAVLAPAPKHAEIASRVNAQRETVTKRISVLRKLGVIQTTGREIAVPDLRRLKMLSGR